MTALLPVLAGVFTTVLVGVAGVGYFLWRPYRESPAESLPASALLLSANDAAAPFWTQLLAHLGECLPASASRLSSTRHRLSEAGYRSPAAAVVYLGLRSTAMICLGALVGLSVLASRRELFPALVAGVSGFAVGYLAPDRFLNRKALRRAGRLRRALPPALDLIVLSIEAGQSLDSSLLEASRQLRETFPDLCSELFLTQWELNSGTGRSQAFRNLAQRNSEPEISKLANALVDADRFGVALGPVLRTHAKHLRTRQRQRAQAAARKISVKMVFPLVLLIFPSMLLVTLGPALIQLTDALGRLMAGS